MIEPLVTTLLFPVCSCMCGIYPSLFLRRHRLLPPAVCGANCANPYQHMFPVPQGRDFCLNRPVPQRVLIRFSFLQLFHWCGSGKLWKSSVLTFLAYSPLKLDHSFNYKYFLSPPGLLTLAAPYHPQSIVKNIRTNLKFNPHPHAEGDPNLMHFM